MSRVKLIVSFALVAGCSGGSTPPPFGVPITGGTLHVTKSGHAVVSDPDRDRIAIVDLASGRTTTELALTPGDEPGRVIEDGAGRLHVALRRGGSVMTLASAASGEVTALRAVCPEPRGVAWDATSDSIHVACTGGELVTFPAAGGDATRRLRLDRDLRDVIVSGGGQLVVTRFRSAELLTLDATGAIVQRTTPPPVLRFLSGGPFPFPSPTPDGPSDPTSTAPEAFATTAWRAVPLADGRIVVSHQRAVDKTLGDDDKQPGGYGGGCNKGPVEASMSLVTAGQPPMALEPVAHGALPVDIALSPGDAKIALVLAGQNTVTVLDTATAFQRPDRDKCEPDDDDDDKDDDVDEGHDLGAPTSAAFAPNGDLVIFYPEKPALVVRVGAGAAKRLIPLSGATSYDSGRRIFHEQTSIALACASCHPEGRDDGRVWKFQVSGPRRTQSLAGDLLERAPFHWSGDMKTLDVLMDDVFVQRMSGDPVDPHEKVGLAAFLGRIPAPAPGAVADTTAVARGQVIFQSSQAGCATCHSGALLTNNALVNVGTGAPFKVPSLLGIGARAPFMHDGCAATLADRFGPTCGGGDAHGRTSHLSQTELSDLIAYLESL
jgi:mono/diheme cytochrome c family protein/cytochrome c553